MKYELILLAVGVLMGVIAGFLVITFDFSPYITGLIGLVVVLAVLCILLMYVAYKRGRLKNVLGEQVVLQVFSYS